MSVPTPWTSPWMLLLSYSHQEGSHTRALVSGHFSPQIILRNGKEGPTRRQHTSLRLGDVGGGTLWKVSDKSSLGDGKMFQRSLERKDEIWKDGMGSGVLGQETKGLGSRRSCSSWGWWQQNYFTRMQEIRSPKGNMRRSEGLAGMRRTAVQGTPVQKSTVAEHLVRRHVLARPESRGRVERDCKCDQARQ